MQTEEFYQNLRTNCLHADTAKAYPAWPYPMMFQDVEISRDIFILDQVIDRRGLELGLNPIHDLTSEDRLDLGSWFHYEFFNVWGPAQGSVEAIPMHVRLCHLRSKLLEASLDSNLAAFLANELSVHLATEMINSFVAYLEQLINACRGQHVVVWGIKSDDNAAAKHFALLDSARTVPAKIMLNLPHMKRAHKRWQDTLKSEEKEMRKAEAALNKFRKTINKSR